jgi:hypothetical protein
MVTVADIRAYPLNDIPTSDESDNVIQGAINQATQYITYIQRSDATTAQVEAATRALGGYLAYLAYFDRPVQDVAGAFTDGYFTPSTGTEGIPQIRSVSDARAKQVALRDAAQMFINMIAKANIVNGVFEKKFIPYMGLTSVIS